ncbi:MAG: DUF1801 domain-containing protein [bacterium]
MAELKTQANDGDVTRFLDSVEDERQREESYVLLETMREISGSEPVMYGTSIVGFGSSTITYADGRTAEWFSVGFSPRKDKLSLYIVDDAEKQGDILSRLGKYKHGKSCIWVKRLADIDMDVLRELIAREVQKR